MAIRRICGSLFDPEPSSLYQNRSRETHPWLLVIGELLDIDDFALDVENRLLNARRLHRCRGRLM